MASYELTQLAVKHLDRTKATHFFKNFKAPTRKRKFTKNLKPYEKNSDCEKLMIRTAKNLLRKKKQQEKLEKDQSMGLTIKKAEVVPDKPPLNHIMENLDLEDFTP